MPATRSGTKRKFSSAEAKAPAPSALPESTAALLVALTDNCLAFLAQEVYGDAASLAERFAERFCKIIWDEVVDDARSPEDWVAMIVTLIDETCAGSQEAAVLVVGFTADLSGDSFSFLTTKPLEEQMMTPLMSRLDAHRDAPSDSLARTGDMVTKVCALLFHDMPRELFSPVEDAFRRRREASAGESLLPLVDLLTTLRATLQPGLLLSTAQAAHLGLHMLNFIPPKSTEGEDAGFETAGASARTLPPGVERSALAPLSSPSVKWESQLDRVRDLIVLMCSTPWELRGAHSTFASAVCYYGNFGDTPPNVLVAL